MYLFSVMTYNWEDLLALSNRGHGKDLPIQSRIRLLGLDVKYDLHMPPIFGRRGKTLHHTQSGGNPKNVISFQSEPSFNHNMNVASVSCRSLK